jgi:hypothetical protein
VQTPKVIRNLFSTGFHNESKHCFSYTDVIAHYPIRAQVKQLRHYSITLSPINWSSSSLQPLDQACMVGHGTPSRRASTSFSQLSHSGLIVRFLIYHTTHFGRFSFDLTTRIPTLVYFVISRLLKPAAPLDLLREISTNKSVKQQLGQERLAQPLL